MKNKNKIVIIKLECTCDYDVERVGHHEPTCPFSLPLPDKMKNKIKLIGSRKSGYVLEKFVPKYGTTQLIDLTAEEIIELYYQFINNK